MYLKSYHRNEEMDYKYMFSFRILPLLILALHIKTLFQQFFSRIILDVSIYSKKKKKCMVVM